MYLFISASSRIRATLVLIAYISTVFSLIPWLLYSAHLPTAHIVSSSRFPPLCFPDSGFQKSRFVASCRSVLELFWVSTESLRITDNRNRLSDGMGVLGVAIAVLCSHCALMVNACGWNPANVDTSAASIDGGFVFPVLHF